MEIAKPVGSENPSDKLFCPHCSEALLPGAHFCIGCGEHIAPEHTRAKAQAEDSTSPPTEREMADMVRIRYLPVTDVNLNALRSKAIAREWGWLPVLSVTCAIGVFLVALAYEGGRISAAWGEPLFWFGLLAIFLPVAARLLSQKPARRERVGLLVVLAISLYFVQILQYPLYFAGYDEFLHVRTAQDIAASGRLFSTNPLLPISAFYPGLEIVTNALSSLTGLSIFVAGSVLIGTAWLVLVPSLYLIYERISDSMWIAGMATLLYMTNPNFVFFDSIFAYESLALSLAVFVLFLVVRRGYVSGRPRLGFTIAAWLGIGAIVVTHHLTSFMLLGFLLVWTVVFLLLWKLRPGRERIERGSASPTPGPYTPNQTIEANPGGIVVVSLMLTSAWLIYTGGAALGYLTPHVTGALSQLVQIATHHSQARQPFQSTTATGSPLWERLMVYASLVLILLGLPFGLFAAWRRYRSSAFALALACAVFAFPGILILHLTQTGAEVASRSTEFLFVAIAFVLAMAARRFLLPVTSWSCAPGRKDGMIITRVRPCITLCALAVLFVGQIAMSAGSSGSFLPGPYQVSADDRSIEPEGITAAVWANTYLGPGHIVASDRDNTELMATYGRQFAETSGSARIAVSWVFLATQFGTGVVTILRQDHIQYLVVDLRLSTALPATGTYFNNGEPGAQHYTQPIDRAALEKFDFVPGVSRIFDGGDIIIYDVEQISNGTLSGSPLPSTPVPVPKPSFPKQGTNEYDIRKTLPGSTSR
ncbi:MAG TPA: hypothetical protein VKV20_02095 [Ktedonobacteraceae bacterium]|jgi:hypothetical protein|nr:hypothetical protein [Ktedonobacteraceae bacterium]